MGKGLSPYHPYVCVSQQKPQRAGRSAKNLVPPDFGKVGKKAEVVAHLPPRDGKKQPTPKSTQRRPSTRSEFKILTRCLMDAMGQ